MEQQEVAMECLRGKKLTNFDIHFHTAFRPMDKAGNIIKPLDLVIIDEIPKDYPWLEEAPKLAEYAGKYGLVTYFMNKPFVFDRKDLPGWITQDGKNVHVQTKRIDGDEVLAFSFWLPTTCLIRIPYNFLIMSLFADYPWQMTDDDGISDHFFVVRGMEQFDYLEKVLNAPYESLAKAHEASAALIEDARSR